MTGIIARVAGLALLGVPLCLSAKETNPTGPTDAKRGPEQHASWCAANGGGKTVSGSIIGVATDWWGSKNLPFTFKASDGTTYVEQSGYDYSAPEGQFMAVTINSAYISKSTVVLYCGSNGTVASIYLNQGP